MFELTTLGHRNHPSFYDPFQALDEMERDFFNAGNVPAFKTDLTENDKEVILEAELPGFDKKDIAIDLNGNYLTISAERKENKEDKDKKGNVIHRERRYGSFSRSFDVEGINTEKISASYDNGVLTLTMPKKEELIPTSRRLEIE